MTISTTQSRIGYNGNGVTDEFAFPYPFLENSDLVVILTDSTGADTTLIPNTDYTVAGAGNPSGGTVTVSTAPAVGERLTILRVMSLTQETDYITGDPFPAESHERALDRLTMIAQQLQEELDRSAKLPVTSEADAESLVADIITLADIADDISDVAAIDAQVSTVAGISGNVTTVAGITANVTTVAGVAANVTTVAGIAADVAAVAADAVDIGTVATNIADVITVADALANPLSAASAVSFDNTASGLAATNVQELGDELAAEKLDATGGTATNLTVAGILSQGSIQETPVIGNAGTSYTINLANGTLYRRNLNRAHCDFVLPDPAAWPGASFTLAVRLGANGRTYAFTGGTMVWDENGPPDASTQSGRTDVYVFTSINGYWLATVVGIGYQAG